ncbi:MAG: Regulatory protein afsR [Candidatus Eremiobacteraeota bacterium]|nr:Regulatory protein afsR [Candidatus Eremiobacteraeota bacterium]
MEAESLTSSSSAVARLKTPDSGDTKPELLGTAFAVGPDTALTAFHCVGDMRTQTLRHTNVVLHFISDRPPVRAQVVSFSADADFAVLRLEHPLAGDLQCLRLVRGVRRFDKFWSWGFPAQATLLQLSQVSGDVEDPAALLQNGAKAVSLFCREAVSLDLRGLSGGPVLIVHQDHEAVFGIVRQTQQIDRDNPLAVGNIFVACPVKSVIDAYPALDEFACCPVSQNDVRKVVSLAVKVAVPSAPPSVSPLDSSPWVSMTAREPEGVALEAVGLYEKPLRHGDTILVRVAQQLQTRWKDPKTEAIIAWQREPDGAILSLERPTVGARGVATSFTGYALCVPSFGVDIEWREATHVFGPMWGPIKLKTVRAFVAACRDKLLRAQIVRISGDGTKMNLTCAEYDRWLSQAWPYYKGLESALSRNGLYQNETAVKLRQEGQLLPVAHELIDSGRLGDMIPRRYRYLIGDRAIDPLDVQLVLEGLIDQYQQRVVGKPALG